MVRNPIVRHLPPDRYDIRTVQGLLGRKELGFQQAKETETHYIMIREAKSAV